MLARLDRVIASGSAPSGSPNDGGDLILGLGRRTGSSSSLRLGVDGHPHRGSAGATPPASRRWRPRRRSRWPGGKDWAIPLRCTRPSASLFGHQRAGLSAPEWWFRLQHPIADPGGGAVRSRRRTGARSPGRTGWSTETGPGRRPGRPSSSSVLREHRAGEHHRAAVLLALVVGHVRWRVVGAPFSRELAHRQRRADRAGGC